MISVVAAAQHEDVIRGKMQLPLSKEIDQILVLQLNSEASFKTVIISALSQETTFDFLNNSNFH